VLKDTWKFYQNKGAYYMTDKDKRTTSKFISLVLRHKPQAANLTLDENGWADVDKPVTPADLKEIVESSDKQRFSFNDDGTKIRANQGHSVQVDVELKEAHPPAVLYHGTAERFISSIKSNGLQPQTRLHVHLSADEDTAVKVGRRHGKPVVLIIDAAKMSAGGFKFYLSENGVWLTEHVPAEYLKESKSYV
jgi:putative RNA 2'-phosphotransferase